MNPVASAAVVNPDSTANSIELCRQPCNSITMRSPGSCRQPGWQVDVVLPGPMRAGVAAVDPPTG